MTRLLLPAVLIGSALASIQPAGATVYSVGAGAACTHADLQGAIDTARAAPGGPHEIRLLTGEQFLSDHVLVFNPVGDLVIAGGYPECDAGSPDAGARTVLRQTMANRSLIRITNDPVHDRRHVTLRRLTLTGGNTPTIIGGGAAVTDRATLVLEQQTRIEDNVAAFGGGVGLRGTAADASAELVMRDGSSVSENQAIDPLGRGGGIYLRGYGAVRLVNGEVNDNRARHAGGGVAIDGWGTTFASLHINPPAVPDAGSPVVLARNVAGQETFSETEGFGGAIHSEFGRVDITAPDVGQFTTMLVENEANFGGAIYVKGQASDTVVVFVDIRNAWIAGNIARGKGGAFYSQNRVQWQISHSTHGECLLGGVAYPCSVIAGNEARNETTPGHPAGGVAHARNSVGTPGGTFRFFRTLFIGNDDVDGRAAIAQAYYDSALIFERCVFMGNRAGNSEGALFGNAAGMDTVFAFNTVLGNDVGTLFAMDGGMLRTQGSILWDPGKPVWTAKNGASMVHNACLIAHTDVDLPGGVTMVDPDLDSRLAPRGGSPAIDHCDELGFVPAIDLYRQDSDYDAPGVASIYGNHDLGAVENRDIVFFNGFGERFAN